MVNQAKESIPFAEQKKKKKKLEGVGVSIDFNHRKNKQKCFLFPSSHSTTPVKNILAKKRTKLKEREEK